MVKFPTPWGIKVIFGEQLASRSCYRANFKVITQPVSEVSLIQESSCSEAGPSEVQEVLQEEEETTRQSPSTYAELQIENLDEVQINSEFPDRIVLVGAQLAAPFREELIALLCEHQDCFAWSHADMTGIDPSIITHQLQVDPSHASVKQKRRRFAPERDLIIDEEVQKLINNGSIREVKYPDWLANVVVVKKKNGKIECVSILWI